MTAKRTPGPWVYSFESVDPEWAVITTKGGAVICNVNAGHRQEANARLIAAAPELLAALQGLLHNTLSNQSAKGQEAVRAARAAIAKANGQ